MADELLIEFRAVEIILILRHSEVVSIKQLYELVKNVSRAEPVAVARRRGEGFFARLFG